MNTEEIAGLVSGIAVATDLAFHVYNFGVPRVWEINSYRTGDGLRNVGSIAGVATTATVSGVASEDLKGTIDALPKAYDRIVGRSAVAGAFLATKSVVQTGVVLAYSLVVPDGRVVAADYIVKQLAPSLVINSLAAFVIPYALSN